MSTVTAYNPPSSRAVVHIPEGLADRYEAVGWTKVKDVKPEPEKAPARRSSKKSDK